MAVSESSCLNFQSLLQLANFYAISSSSSSHARKSVTFGDKIGLCSERVLYSWRGKDIERKVIVITSTVPEDVDSMVQKSLMVSQRIPYMTSMCWNISVR